MALQDILSQFQNGGQNVTTQGMNFAQGGLPGMQSSALQGMGGFGDSLNQMFRYKAELAAQDRAKKDQQYADQLRMAQTSQRMEQQKALQDQDRYNDAMKMSQQQQNDPLVLAQKRQAIIEADEATRPAPLKLVTGMNIIPGYTMDPNAMSAHQRQMFLPKEAGLSAADHSSNIAPLQSNNLGPWELGGARQAFSTGAPRADNNLMQGARDSAQGAGYQGANGGGGRGGRTDYTGVTIPDISEGLGAYGQRPMDRTASFNQYASGAPGQSSGKKPKKKSDDDGDE